MSALEYLKLERIWVIQLSFDPWKKSQLDEFYSKMKYQKYSQKEGIRGLDSIDIFWGFRISDPNPTKKEKNLSHLTEIRILELGNPTTAAKPDIKSSCAASKHHCHPTTPPKRHPCRMILGSD